MALRSEPTARQLRLAVELRRLRDAAGLTAREAAALLGVTAPAISQIESGLAGVSEKRLRLLASHYACTDEEFIDALVTMATDRTRGWWEEYRGLLPTPFLNLSELDHHSRFQYNVAIVFVPGLLQTADYARAVYATRVPELTEEELELRVRHRLARRVIFEGPSPTPFDAVIHEAALRTMVGTRTAARAQLAHILELSEADHITVRVIPFDREGFSGGSSSMAYLGGSVTKLDTVIRDGPTGALYIDAEDQLATYRARFHHVRAMALEPGHSRDFIQRLAKEL
ncbi:transcriptional regulator [Streptomyces sp. Ru62]|uniref:helix-turn-helix domain-containing protein n=1 Tax=Streptomyces sp. Ru62 TaxID=2080745 RepID=UPI000CDD0338|nr:helix-turn-helix transcriptional regulator [Streptomyces sp. Ru62]POX64859.1 transcriptional regulator [Streptomyces sp. Ru62]